MTLAERLAETYTRKSSRFERPMADDLDMVRAINEALEEAAKEVEVCLQIYAKSGGRKSLRLTKVGVCMGVAMRIRALK